MSVRRLFGTPNLLCRIKIGNTFRKICRYSRFPVCMGKESELRSGHIENSKLKERKSLKNKTDLLGMISSTICLRNSLIYSTRAIGALRQPGGYTCLQPFFVQSIQRYSKSSSYLGAQLRQPAGSATNDPSDMQNSCGWSSPERVPAIRF